MYPYRLDLFDGLAEKFELTAFFCEEKADHRKWKVSPSKCSFRVIEGRGLRLGPIMINSNILQALLRHKPDIYIISSLGLRTILSALLTLFIAKLRAKPVIFWTGFVKTNFYKKEHPLKYFFGNKVRNFFASYSTACISYSKKTTNYLTEVLHIENEKIFTGTQVMPESLIPDSHKKIKRNSDTTNILTVSYFQERKGVDILINAYKDLNIKQSKLFIAGTGKEEDKLKEISGGAENIKFLGYIEGKEKAHYYSLADIFVLPTLHDPWGLVINEAMHFGLPIITTENAGARELIKENGLIIKPGSVEELKTSLQKLIRENEVREDMGKKSKNYIHSYNMNYVISTFTDAVKFIRTQNSNYV